MNLNMFDWTMIKAEKQQLNVKRVASKKRSRDPLRSHLTPARKRGPQGPTGETGKAQGPPGETGKVQGPPAKGKQHATTSIEYCSDSEDLFGNYNDEDEDEDSLLGDLSLLARLDRVERTARETPHPDGTTGLDPPPRQTTPHPDGTTGLDPAPRTTNALDQPPLFMALRPPDPASSPSPGPPDPASSPTPGPPDPASSPSQTLGFEEEELSESLLAGFGDSFREVAVPANQRRDSFREVAAPSNQRDSFIEVAVPANQSDFHEEVVEHAADRSSTPCQQPEVETKDQDAPRRRSERERPPVARRSMADLLKRCMLGNATASGPAPPSRSAALQEAVLSEELGVARWAAEEEAAERGPFYGLPALVKTVLFNQKGIHDLYEWQKACLSLQSVTERRNLIYSLPTSGGKTLVAEILILRELLCRKRDCMFILPYVSLVQEKVRGLSTLGLELDFVVEEYAGSKGRFPPVRRRQNRVLYVCTIEKGHSLVNCLIETQRLDDVGLVVVDELHMLGDGSRGAIIEMTLAKVMHVADATQIIGMSATLGNVRDLQMFLRAENFENDFRPVQLQEFVKLKDSIYEVDPREDDGIRLSRSLNFKYSSNMQKADPDHIVALVTEVIPAHSCLVFCPTKKNCENVAVMICKYLTEAFVQRKKEEKASLLRALRDSVGGSMCPVLRRTVPYGLAYHHSGLTADERRLVEEAYSSGTLCLLACTSTLAAGVNLPARRVILRSPYVATDFLKRSQYKQMVGRAGRAGIDSMGESILILQERDRSMAKNLLCAPMENCYSNLMTDDGKALRSLMLSLIGLKISTSLEHLRTFLFTNTLLSVQQRALCPAERGGLQEECDRALETLKVKGLVEVICPETGSLQVTRLGGATFKGSVDLSVCVLLYRDLSVGLEGLLLESFLHLLYLVTPYDFLSVCKPDWMVYLRQYVQLSAAEQRCCAAVGVPESFITRKAAGQTTKKSVDMAVAQRLYLAMVLYCVLRDPPGDLWGVGRAVSSSAAASLQNLLSSASAFCSCVLHFTEELSELWPYKALLSELTRRLTYCVQSELVPLMEVAGVMQSRARQLYNAGFKTLPLLAGADPAALSASVENLFHKQARQIIASAKMLLSEKAAALQEEMDDLLMIGPVDQPVLIGPVDQPVLIGPKEPVV